METRALTRRARASALLVPLLVLSTAGGVARAQSWEYSPYQIKAWVALANKPELTDRMRADLERALVEQARVVAGATWFVEPAPAPEILRESMISAMDELTSEQIGAVDEDVFDGDKIFLIAIDTDVDGFHIAVREVDCRVRVLSDTLRKRVAQPEQVVKTTFSAVVDVFSPVVRIEKSAGKGASIRVRAGGLVVKEDSPSRVAKGDVFRPFIRKNDRFGNPKENGIETIRWTFLHVSDDEGFLKDCQVDSSRRNPLAGRSSSRTLKIGLGARPTRSSSVLQLMSLGDDPKPLEGYEVFSKRPVETEDGKKPKAVRLGRTDWRGMIEIPEADFPVTLVYVRNGTFLLARLPIVPGLQENLMVQLTEDDKRLEAEAFKKGMESTVMDLVAQRKILAERIRRRLKAGDFEDAITAREELSLLATRGDLDVAINNRQSTLASANEREQVRIDRLLTGTRMLLANWLGTDISLTMKAEIEKAMGVESDEPEGNANGATKGGKKKADKKKKAKS